MRVVLQILLTLVEKIYLSKSFHVEQIYNGIDNNYFF
jgi:hypothetical protein